MRVPGFLAAVTASATLLAVTAGIAAQGPASVESVVDLVRTGPDDLIVNVRASVPVLEVLKFVCREANATCTIPEHLIAPPLAPLRARGTWTTVLGELLSGSGLNYATTPATAEAAPILMITEAEPLSRSTESGRAPGRTTLLDAPEAVPEVADQAIAEPAESEVAAPSAGSEPIGPLTMADTMTPAGAQAAAMMPVPFTDPQGKPMMVPIPTEQTAIPVGMTPFSTPDGNPLVVEPAPPSTVAPFSDPDGNPIPIPPPTPGVKLEHPLQPNPILAVKKK